MPDDYGEYDRSFNGAVKLLYCVFGGNAADACVTFVYLVRVGRLPDMLEY